jgi:hypothetical protein
MIELGDKHAQQENGVRPRLAALEHARVLKTGAALGYGRHRRATQANRGGCAICRSTAGMYSRATDEIAEELISDAATHVEVCDTVEFGVAKGGAFARAHLGELALQRGARNVVLPAPRGGRLARRFGRDEAGLARRRGVAEAIRGRWVV